MNNNAVNMIFSFFLSTTADNWTKMIFCTQIMKLKVYKERKIK